MFKVPIEVENNVKVHFILNFFNIPSSELVIGQLVPLIESLKGPATDPNNCKLVSISAGQPSACQLLSVSALYLVSFIFCQL